MESATVGAALMVSGMLAVPIAPVGSVTVNVGVKEPESVGVPDRTPPGLTDIPFGKPGPRPRGGFHSVPAP
ncbi:MAG: hypothetical protein WDO73_17895 [Ignavibacteriota bacterium]